MALGIKKIEDVEVNENFSIEKKRKSVITLDDLGDMFDDDSVGDMVLSGNEQGAPAVIPEIDGRKKIAFKKAPRPPLEVIKKKFGGKPVVFIGEYAISCDSANFDVFVWREGEVLKGKHKGEHTASYTVVGHYHLFENAVKAIRRKLEEAALSQADGKHLIDAIVRLETMNEKLIKAISSIDSNKLQQVVDDESLEEVSDE